jgi:phosphatidyl-myo-inositol alpha-mannosyltransferase
MTERPLRIALVHPHVWPEVRRGGERYLDDLAWYLTGAGHRVDLITGTKGSAHVGRSQGATVRAYRHVRSARLERRGVSRTETFGAVALLPMLRRRYDIVHALTPGAAIAARLAGQRTLYTVLGHPVPEIFGHGAVRGLTAAAVRVAHAVAALSNASAEQVRRAFGRKAEVLHPGVRLDHFRTGSGERRGPPRVLFTSYATDPNKGLGLLLTAVGLLLERVPDARLALSGPGDPRPILDGVREGRVRDAIDVLGLGEPASLPQLYRSASVTALPSLHEAFGLTLVESLACGTPVVCTASGGMPEIVSRSEVGRVFAPGDVAGLSRALEEVILLSRDPRTRRRCRLHARRWGWRERVGPAHEELYQRLVRTRS